MGERKTKIKKKGIKIENQGNMMYHQDRVRDRHVINHHRIHRVIDIVRVQDHHHTVDIHEEEDIHALGPDPDRDHDHIIDEVIRKKIAQKKKKKSGKDKKKED